MSTRGMTAEERPADEPVTEGGTPPSPSRASIRVLPPDVAARIAAGEVIERPVSVVRELLDNAIDAGSRRIAVEIADGGLALIRVTDDGRGIPPEQVELAFERHATSKIAALPDLARVATLGFRGEALPSIAAAGDVELVSRAAGEDIGVQAVLVDARVVRHTAKPAPPGTSFTVRDLFARLPARRKFIASAAAESRQVTVLVSHYALAYPGIAFSLMVNARRVLATGGDGSLRNAFAAVYGADAAAQMLTVDGTGDDAQVSGLAGPPALHRGNRSGISVFVNGRWVQSRPLVFAAVDAYQSQLPIGRHPLAALTITLDSELVDVNVHPAKAEVRFRDERAVGRAVRRAVSAALEGSQPVAWTSWSAPARPPAAAAAASAERAALLQVPDLRSRLDPPAALRQPEATQTRLELASAEAGTSDPPATAASPHTQRAILPLLRVVGQMGLTYVVAEGPDGMYLIDQHAAHERVVYDRLVARREVETLVQPLLEPALVELDIPLAAILDEHREALAELGLLIEPFGEREQLVRTVPRGFGGREIATEVRALLEQLAAERRVEGTWGRALATVACHSSVRAGMAMALEEMRRLVEDLEVTATPRTCPHGRPTLIHLGTETIERQFARR